MMQNLLPVTSKAITISTGLQGFGCLSTSPGTAFQAFLFVIPQLSARVVLVVPAAACGPLQRTQGLGL